MPNSTAEPTKEVFLTRKQKLNLTFATLRTVRSTWEPDWMDISQHQDPYGFLLTPFMANRGDRRDIKILDNTARKAGDIVESGMFTGITPSASQWFKMRHPKKEINEIDSVQLWCEYVTEVFERVFEISNFYNQTPPFFRQAATYATGALFDEPDPQTISNFTHFPIGSYWCSCNDKGMVDTFFWQERMTTREIVDKYLRDKYTREIDWSNASSKLKTAFENKQFEVQFDIINVIAPNELYEEGSARTKKKKYAWLTYEWSLNAESSTAQEEGAVDVFLRESGFDDFPVYVVPMKRTNPLDSYGTDCQGKKALGNVKQLFFEISNRLKIQEKVESPIMTGAASKNQTDFDNMPWTFIPEDMASTGKGVRPAYDLSQVNLEHIDKKIKMLQDAIMDDWDATTFQLLSNYENLKDVTATAITELQAEKLQKLGATYGAFDFHFLKRLFRNTFKRCWAMGLIPQPPPEMGGILPEPEFLGVMAQAMKLSGLSMIKNGLGILGEINQAFPQAQIADNLNFDKLAREITIKRLSWTPDLLNSMDDVQKIRAARAQAIQAQQQAQQLPQAAGAAKDLAATPMNEDNALTRLMGLNKAPA